VDELNLSDKSTIVDIGCGTGSALRYATSKIMEGILIGIDPVLRMIEIANELTTNHEGRDRIEFRVGSAEKIPVEDCYADFVLAFDSIDHWQDIEQGFCEVKRIMRPSGVFAIVKDIDTPGVKESLEKLTGKLASAEFEVKENREISHKNISFYFLQCQIIE
jgi:ubiquinone/menaquinone biosynthesis C-methylase UbiE